jgi:hypothetical protein
VQRLVGLNVFLAADADAWGHSCAAVRQSLGQL